METVFTRGALGQVAPSPNASLAVVGQNDAAQGTHSDNGTAVESPGAAYRRVLIVDWDVHHGNGTQDIFYEDGSVLFFSAHQWPWYPGTGARDETGSGAGAGMTINHPLPAGSGHDGIFDAFLNSLVPAADAFRPDFVFISAGFDSRLGDPLGSFTLTDEDFAGLTKIVLGIAARHAAGRVVSVLEGGYNLRGLGSAAAAHVRALSA